MVKLDILVKNLFLSLKKLVIFVEFWTPKIAKYSEKLAIVENFELR